ncbi:hypothetical protein [Ferdinandcohnia sp. Marseille-Q9671]
MTHIKDPLQNLDIEIKKIAIIGSRINRYFYDESDLDIAIEYRGNEREEYVFLTLMEEPLYIDHITVDFLPFWDKKSNGIGNRKQVVLFDEAIHF